ncbi:bifunctional riboflavin kinase/FAD synthetase [Nocardiopsis sediminis]|uniref:Riboflavin biosynthesis protein n=1 Tax=Nocardiopsis sediminis TaxID=1778267 RepID=A0ABV8FXD0_9ACTN
MRRWDGLEGIPRNPGRSVVTIGVFDGVHRGHQGVLRAAVARARAADLPVVAVTFEPHPDSVVRGRPAPAVLTPLDRRVALLGANGADAVCVLPFTEELSRLPAAEFVRQVLVERLNAAAVVVGAGFRFGHRASGDLHELEVLGEKYDFAVEGVPPVADDGTAITSTRIRALIAGGDVGAAAAALGRPHRVGGVIVHGAARGRELLGFPTANLDHPPASAIPADGVYAGWLLHAEPAPGTERYWPAAISVGTNPTFEGSPRTVEAYALDRDDLDLYDAPMAIDFVHRIRAQERFDGIDELIAAMARDVRRAAELMGGAAGPPAPVG